MLIFLSFTKALRKNSDQNQQDVCKLWDNRRKINYRRKRAGGRMKKERDSLLTSSISVFALQKRQLPLFAPADFPRERFDRWTSLWHLVTSGKANLHKQEIKQGTAKKQLEEQETINGISLEKGRSRWRWQVVSQDGSS